MPLVALVPLHLDLTLPAHTELRLKQTPKHQPCAAGATGGQFGTSGQ